MIGSEMSAAFKTLAAMVLVAVAGGTASAELTVTDGLIRTEIIRLGGTWEGESPAALIGLFGENFTSSHFTMLAHIEGAKALCCIDVDVPPTAFESIASIENLERIEIQRGSFSGEGISKLRRLKLLTRLRGYECKLTANGIRNISRIRSLRHVQLHDVDLPLGTLRALSKLKHLQYLAISTSQEIGANEIQKLKIDLPGCEVEIHGQ